MLKLNLALQGGGAHGAFTWGVLDRLLDEPDIEFGRISGTSAGALNGAVFSSGLAEGGRVAAKSRLANLWHRVAIAGFPLTMLLLPLRKPGMGIWDDAMPLFSPYLANPIGMAPLRSILNELVDEEALASKRAPQLFVNAVSVQTGENRIFGPGEVTVEAILASACAPLVFQAVSIGEESYWDGSYAANPPLWPLFQDERDVDLLMVELTPQVRPEIPMTAKNILNRINEIAALNMLKVELRDMMNLNATHGRDIRMHVVSLPSAGTHLEVEPSIKRTVGFELFESLRRMGNVACDRWLALHRPSLGVTSTMDFGAAYLSAGRDTAEGRSIPAS